MPRTHPLAAASPAEPRSSREQRARPANKRRPLRWPPGVQAAGPGAERRRSEPRPPGPAATRPAAAGGGHGARPGGRRGGKPGAERGPAAAPPYRPRARRPAGTSGLRSGGVRSSRSAGKPALPPRRFICSAKPVRLRRALNWPFWFLIASVYLRPCGAARKVRGAVGTEQRALLPCTAKPSEDPSDK